jgi:prepilin-type N-terminal cleavage/methylation domain-containing protein
MKTFRKNKGFSFVEIVVAVLIMSILTTAAIVTYTVVRRRNAMKAAQNLSEALEQARLSALAQNGDYETVLLVYFNGTNYIAQIAETKWKKWTKDVEWTVIKEYKLGTSYTLGDSSLNVLYTYGDDMSESFRRLNKSEDYYTKTVKDKLPQGKNLEKERLRKGPLTVFDANNTDPDKDKTTSIMIFEFSKHDGEKLLGPEIIMFTNSYEYDPTDPTFRGSEVRFSKAGRSYVKEY